MGCLRFGKFPSSLKVAFIEFKDVEASSGRLEGLFGALSGRIGLRFH